MLSTHLSQMQSSRRRGGIYPTLVRARNVVSPHFSRQGK